MKKKKKLIHRIGALICALVLSVSVLGTSVPYYASEDSAISVFREHCVDYRTTVDFDIPYNLVSSYDYYYVFVRSGTYCFLWGTNVPFEYSCISDRNETSKYTYYNLNTVGFGSSGSLYVKALDGSFDWTSTSLGSYGLSSNYSIGASYYEYDNGNTEYRFSSYSYLQFVESNEPIYLSNDNSVFLSASADDVPSYNSNLGYLQNISRKIVFDEVPLGENVNEKYTERWYYDQYTTTGVDLTSGDYFIRYYQERWIVTGYEKEDVVDKGNRYLLGDYLVQNGYIETYSEDVESTLAGQGYEEPTFFDLWFNKFVTTHYYFQVVNAETGEVGGLVHIYLTDDNGSFGVDLIGETTDLDGNVDDDGYSDFIEEDKITTDDTDAGFTELEQNNETTLEEWFESFRDDSIEDLDELEGSDAFSTIFETYVSQVSDVSKSIGAVFELLPPWVVGVFGLSLVLLFVLMILKEN